MKQLFVHLARTAMTPFATQIMIDNQAALTNTGPGWHGGLADPERDPGQNHQQGGGDVRLQNKEQHISPQGKV